MNYVKRHPVGTALWVVLVLVIIILATQFLGMHFDDTSGGPYPSR